MIDVEEFYAYMCEALHVGRLVNLEQAALRNQWNGAAFAALRATVDHVDWPTEQRRAWLAAAGPAAARASAVAAGDYDELGRLVLAECQRQLAVASVGENESLPPPPPPASAEESDPIPQHTPQPPDSLMELQLRTEPVVRQGQEAVGVLSSAAAQAVGRRGDASGTGIAAQADAWLALAGRAATGAVWGALLAEAQAAWRHVAATCTKADGRRYCPLPSHRRS